MPRKVRRRGAPFNGVASVHASHTFSLTVLHTARSYLNMNQRIEPERRPGPRKTGPENRWQADVRSVSSPPRAPRSGTRVLPLTERQREVLQTIEAFLAAHGWPPTLRELCAALRLTSTNGMAQHVTALERKGYIAREADTARGLRLLSPSGGAVVVPPRFPVRAVAHCTHCGKAVA